MRNDNWKEWLYLCGFMLGMVLLGTGIVLGAAYWQAHGVAL